MKRERESVSFSSFVCSLSLSLSLSQKGNKTKLIPSPPPFSSSPRPQRRRRVHDSLHLGPRRRRRGLERRPVDRPAVPRDRGPEGVDDGREAEPEERCLGVGPPGDEDEADEGLGEEEGLFCFSLFSERERERRIERERRKTKRK